MKKISFILTILPFIFFSLNANANKIFDYETYQGCGDLIYTWNDQIIISSGYIERGDLLPYMIEGHEYMVKVTCRYFNGLEEVISFCAPYTCNLNETDEEGNLINADYGTLSDGEYIGFFNIATDVPDDVQEELLGTDYDEDWGEWGPFYTCMHATFGFHFEIDDSSISSIHIEVFDECQNCEDCDDCGDSCNGCDCCHPDY